MSNYKCIQSVRTNRRQYSPGIEISYTEYNMLQYSEKRCFREIEQGSVMDGLTRDFGFSQPTLDPVSDSWSYSPTYDSGNSDSSGSSSSGPDFGGGDFGGGGASDSY